MKNLDQWLAEYAVSHRNPTNIKIHNICVPLIMFSVLGLLWSVPKIELMNNIFLLNWATVFSLLCMAFYFTLGLRIAALMFATLIPMVGILYYLDSAGMPVFYLSLGIFIVSWIGQFIGHKIEGKKPSFFKDLQFLLIGPVWVFAKHRN